MTHPARALQSKNGLNCIKNHDFPQGGAYWALFSTGPFGGARAPRAPPAPPLASSLHTITSPFRVLHSEHLLRTRLELWTRNILYKTIRLGLSMMCSIRFWFFRFWILSRAIARKQIEQDFSPLFHRHFWLIFQSSLLLVNKSPKMSRNWEKKWRKTTL